MSLFPRMSDREMAYALSPPGNAALVPSSPHIARLAFAGGIARKAASGAAVTEEETAKAREMRIVTAVTGAVVLENAEQYEDHALDPASGSRNVPTIPEPEEYAIMAVVCLLLAAAYLRRLSCARRR
jgi:hypothetical protein